MRAREIVAKAEQLLRCVFYFRKNLRHVGHGQVVPQRDRACSGSIRREFSNHLSDLLSFAGGARVLQLEPRLQLVGIARKALPVALIPPQNKTQQRGVENQHRSLKVFGNVKTLDPNAAEMPPQRADLSPCDGCSSDDYRCRYCDHQSQENEPESQGQLHCQVIDKLPPVVVQRSSPARGTGASIAATLSRLKAFWGPPGLLARPLPQAQTDKDESQNTAC